MRAKVDDFLYLLVAAVVIIIITLVAFMAIPPGGIGIIVPVANLTLGSVGFTGENMVSRSYGDFQVGASNKDVVKSVPQIEVSSSYFGGKAESQEVRILNAYVPLAKEALVTFTVRDSTPRYGRLIIKWNGLELYSDGAGKGGPYTLHVPREQIKEINNLQISCDGPGAYFWASTVYVLRDFKVTLDYGTMKIIPFTLGADGIETFKNGALEFSSSGTAKLTVKVNGALVSSKVPGSESIKFDLFNSAVSPGNNIISLSTDGTGTSSLRDVALKLFFSTGQTFRERIFSIPASNFSLFSQGYQGKIEFDVDSIMKQGAMRVQLNGHDLNVPSVQQGANTLIFTGKEAVQGQNTLSFSGTGGWEISQVRIFLER